MGLGSRSKIIGVATLNIYNIGYGVVKSYKHIPPKDGETGLRGVTQPHQNVYKISLFYSKFSLSFILKICNFGKYQCPLI